jgi:threonine synthase
LRYVSTRGTAPILDFEGALLAGLARDGGLYLPETWPTFSKAEIAAFAGLSYAETVTRVAMPFMGGAIPETELAEIAAASYAGFDHAATAPLRQLERGLWLLELFHGPTLAFKDYALQFVGRLFDHVLRRRGQSITIIGATSGDTGSAAIEACRGLAAVDIFILHPRGRVSEIQRRMMTTVEAPNVHNIAIEGTFDDCQGLVKAMFADAAFRDELRLSAVNSINWARIMAQTAYYFYAAVALGAPGRAVSFAVPTGNFGNVYAGHVARRLGLPVDRLLVGSNRNDVLTRYFATGVLEAGPVVPSLSPSMDIQVSSNFERLLFELHYRDGAAVTEAMARFRTDGRLDIGPARWRASTALFEGSRLDDDETLAVIAGLHSTTGLLVDPHTAVGIAAARANRGDGAVPVIALATAHAAKFPDAVEAATGIRPALPRRLADLTEREERMTSLPKDIEDVKAFVRARASLAGAA